MRISDWSSDVCSSDLAAMGALLDYVELTQVGRMPALAPPRRAASASAMQIDAATRANLELVKTLKGEARGSLLATIDRTEIGRAPCRERVWQSVYIWVVAV